MKYISTIGGILLLFVISAQSATPHPTGPVSIFPADISSLIKSGGPSIADYPGAGALTILNEESMQVEPDGYYRITIRGAVKIFDQRGISAYGEIRIPFNSHYQSAKLDYARTTRADGRVFNVAEDAVFELTPPEFAAYKIYTDFKFLTFTLPALEPGSIVEFSVTLTSKEPFIPGRWWEYMNIDRTEPTLIMAFHLKVPKGEKFLLKTRNFSVQPTVTDMGDYEVHSIKLFNLPPLKLEPNMPPIEDVSRSIAVTDMSTWEEFNDWWAPLFFNRMNPFDPDIKSKVGELTKGLDSDVDKIGAIYRYVQNEIRYVGLEFRMAAYKPHEAEEVLLNKYGDCKDMSLLIITMLETIGIKGYPALLNPKSKGMTNRDMPTPLEFTHVITYVPMSDGNDLWLDPTSRITPFRSLPHDDQGIWVMVAQRDKPVWIKTPMANEKMNRLEKTFLFQLNPDGSSDSLEVMEGYGFFNLNLKSTYLPQSKTEREQNFRKYLSLSRPTSRFKSLSFSDLKNQDVPFKYAMRYSQTALFQSDQAGSLKGRVAPTLVYSVVDKSIPKNRVHAFPLKGPFTMLETYEINLPAGYKFANIPKGQYLTNGYAAFASSFEPNKNGLKIQYKLTIRKEKINPEDFGKFVDFLNEAAAMDTLLIASSRVGETKTGQDYGHFGEAQVLLETGLYAEAERLLRAYLASNPPSSEAHRLLGVALKSMDNAVESRVEFEKALSIDPDNPYAYYGIGELLFAQRRWIDAENQFRKAIEVKPEEADFLVGLGASLYMQGKTPDAVPLLERAVQLNSENAAGHTFLGLSYVKIGMLSSAYKSLDSSLSLSGTGFMVNRVKGNFKLLGEYEKASGTDGGKQVPIKTVLSLGMKSKSKGYYSLAEAFFRKVTQRDPSWTEGYLQLSRLYLSSARYDEAYKILEKTIQLDPDRGESHYYLAAALGHLGKMDKANEEFKTARELGFVE